MTGASSIKWQVRDWVDYEDLFYDQKSLSVRAKPFTSQPNKNMYVSFLQIARFSSKFPFATLWEHTYLWIGSEQKNVNYHCPIPDFDFHMALADELCAGLTLGWKVVQMMNPASPEVVEREFNDQ
jgi:hypothetical protein